MQRTIEEHANILFGFVKKKKEEGIIDSSNKEVVAEAEKLDVKSKKPLVLTKFFLMRRYRTNLEIQLPFPQILSQEKDQW